MKAELVSRIASLQSVAAAYVASDSSENFRALELEVESFQDFWVANDFVLSPCTNDPEWRKRHGLKVIEL